MCACRQKKKGIHSENYLRTFVAMEVFFLYCTIPISILIDFVYNNSAPKPRA